jgi:hypothetical protein
MTTKNDQGVTELGAWLDSLFPIRTSSTQGAVILKDWIFCDPYVLMANADGLMVRVTDESTLSAVFASNLDDLVSEVNGCLIHGHTHDSFDYNIGKCRVVCNPRGYPRSRDMASGYENPNFRSDLIIEVDTCAS